MEAVSSFVPTERNHSKNPLTILERVLSQHVYLALYYIGA